MAIFTPKLPISGITGPLGSIDRTIKAGTGLAVKFVSRNGKWSLERKTAATKTNTLSKQEWADRYYTCDCKWKKLDANCRQAVDRNRIERGSKYEKTLTTYHYFMRRCLYKAECEIFLYNPCFETHATLTEYTAYLSITAWPSKNICHLWARLILNGQIHTERSTGADGTVQFTIPKTHLQEGNNEIFVQICYQTSNQLDYYIPPTFLNPSFETGDFTGWNHSAGGTRNFRGWNEITNARAQHGEYSYKGTVKNGLGKGSGDNKIWQYIDYTDVDEISLWAATLKTGYMTAWHIFVNIDVAPWQILRVDNPVLPDFTKFIIDTSSITGSHRFEIRNYARSTKNSTGYYYTWIDHIETA